MLTVNPFHTNKSPATRRRSTNLSKTNLALQTRASNSLATVRDPSVRRKEVDAVAMAVVVTASPSVTTTTLWLRAVTRAINRSLRSRRVVRPKLYIER
jgi:hypothetical protein